MGLYIANHRIERRPNKKLVITEPGDEIELSDDEAADLPAASITKIEASAEIELSDDEAATKPLTVDEIKAAIEGADLATLRTMLADEKGGKNRSTAVAAIEAAITAAEDDANDDDADASDAEANDADADAGDTEEQEATDAEGEDLI